MFLIFLVHWILMYFLKGSSEILDKQFGSVQNVFGALDLSHLKRR